jgi:hypothetical protein
MFQAYRAALLIVLMLLTSWMQIPTPNMVSQTDGNTGLIQGFVLYENDRPVAGATVYAHPTDRAMASIVPHADTDKTGHFAIRRLWLGKFAVTAKKEEEDYPDMSQGFYSRGKFEAVTLKSDQTSAIVTIHLGPKAGVLTGAVTDVVTGVGLNPCVDFTWSIDPNNFLSGTGLVNAQYRVLVPSNTGVFMKIWRKGYKPWYYPGTTDKSKREPVRLKPGEEATLNIRLETGNDTNDAGCNTEFCFPHCRP